MVDYIETSAGRIAYRHQAGQGMGVLFCGGYRSDTPAAVDYKATWPEQKVVRCTVSTLAEETRKNCITKTALIVVGDFLGENYERSKLYDPAFTTEFRQGTEAGQ